MGSMGVSESLCKRERKCVSVNGSMGQRQRKRIYLREKEKIAESM